MRTKLSLFCDKVIEAGWLAAAIVVPLFFNIYSQRVFEPDKLSLLRSIALVMGAARIVRAVEDWRFRQAEGRSRPQGPSLGQRLVQTPLVLPTLLLVVVYLVSTILSVVPRVSLAGSYQRLQGTYTTFSYLVIFFLLLEGLRTKRQFDRLITTMILVSFPIALYGMVQHFGLDPLPWGGNVSYRVASNMGNAIFVAAFLIMVVPLTLSRLFENWQQVVRNLGRGDRILAVVLPLAFALMVGFAWVLELPFPPSKPLYFWTSLLASLLFLLAMLAFAYYLRRPAVRLLLVASYLIILIVQVVCIFYSQSRGPLLGLLGGVFFYFALLGLIRRRLWIPWVMVAFALVVGVGLVLFNTLQSPTVEALRKTPYIGRLGKVLQTEEGTGKVRILIWQGVVQMISPHPPLEYPVEGGQPRPDPFNGVRPLIGYGPESMYVAYNRFYQPDLAHYERRNASPDRSHNETFDALVQTGLVGFVVYMLLFASVFYYGLRWLGLIHNRRQGWIWVALWVAGGIGGALVTWLWRGEAYIGIGIPLGVMGGLALYLLGVLVNRTAAPLLARWKGRQATPWSDGGRRYALWLLALVSAIVAHFIEIHFGIAIAATRTYFWTFAALLVVIGTRLALQPAEGQRVVAEDTPSAEEARPGSRRRRRRAPDSPPPPMTKERDWQGAILLLTGVVILILCTMLFDFTTIQPGNPGVLATVWRSLTQVEGKPSPVMLTLFLVTWGMIGLVSLGQLATQEESAGRSRQEWFMAVSLFGLLSFGGALIFALLHAVRLRPVTITSPDAPNPLANTITFYYLFLFLIILSLAAVLTFLFRRPVRAWRLSGSLGDVAVLALGVILPLVAGVLIAATNVSIVRADILYKQGLSSEKAQQWDGAIFFYQKAVEMAPKEDFYYLFLGRAYMEKGKDAQGEDREKLLTQSEKMLKEARELAPLNTDHSANLARLHRTWGGLVQGEQRVAHLNRALDYYAAALSLSPNNAQLYNEWGQTYFALGEYEQAAARYEKSLTIDRQYVQTYLLLGELSMRQKDWDRALEVYQQALEIAPQSVDLYSALGYVYTQKKDLEAALQAYQQAVKLQPKNFNNRKNLAILYQQMGRIEEAIREATEALALAPDNQKQTMQNFLAQLKASSPENAQQIQNLLAQGRQQMDAGEWTAAEATFKKVLELNPNHPQAHSALAYVYAKQGRVEEAIAENQVVIGLAPNDYNSYKNLGLLYQQKGQIAEAIAAVEKALTLAPEEDRAALESFLNQLKALQAQATPTAQPQGRAGDLAPAERNHLYSAPPAMTLDLQKKYQATIVTAKGNIVIDLKAAQAPQTVNNFVYLARQGFYDGLTFHRVENQPGFSLIQGGDPAGNGTGGPGYTVPAEIGLPHDEGAIAMARTADQVNPQRASSGSQFYICLVPIHQLDGAYTVFGYVVEGLDVARQIAVGDKILTILITEK